MAKDDKVVDPLADLDDLPTETAYTGVTGGQQAEAVAEAQQDVPAPPEVAEDPAVKRARLLAELKALEDSEPAEPVMVAGVPMPTPPGGEEDEIERSKRLAHEAALKAGALDPEPTFEERRSTADTIVLHFVEDGFTALGQMWYRGQELEFEVDSEAYWATFNRDHTYSWLMLVGDDGEQMRKYGKVLFRPGPWPGNPWPDDEAAQAERKRNRMAPRPEVLGATPRSAIQTGLVKAPAGATARR